MYHFFKSLQQKKEYKNEVVHCYHFITSRLHCLLHDELLSRLSKIGGNAPMLVALSDFNEDLTEYWLL